MSEDVNFPYVVTNIRPESGRLEELAETEFGLRLLSISPEEIMSPLVVVGPSGKITYLAPHSGGPNGVNWRRYDPRQTQIEDPSAWQEIGKVLSAYYRLYEDPVQDAGTDAKGISTIDYGSITAIVHEDQVDPFVDLVKQHTGHDPTLLTEQPFRWLRSKG